MWDHTLTTSHLSYFLPHISWVAHCMLTWFTSFVWPGLLTCLVCSMQCTDLPSGHQLRLWHPDLERTKTFNEISTVFQAPTGLSWYHCYIGHRLSVGSFIQSQRKQFLLWNPTYIESLAVNFFKYLVQYFRIIISFSSNDPNVLLIGNVTYTPEERISSKFLVLIWRMGI